MHRILTFALAAGLVWAGSTPRAQQTSAAGSAIGTWRLVTFERGVDAGTEPSRAQGPRGLLILDGKGNAFEFFGVGSRQEPDAPQADPQRTFENYGGFWGRYEVSQAGRMRFTALDGVSPSMHDATFSRTFEITDDRMTMASIDEPHAHGGTRWTWERMPTVDHLSPLYRQVVGFWEHVVEGRKDLDSGEMLNETRRAPSLIVYTPSGFVGVHFPPLGREKFAGDAPTPEEAQAALRGYIGYFGTLGVFPGEVSHNLLSGISPATGSILRRSAEIVGDTLTVTLQPLGGSAGRGGQGRGGQGRGSASDRGAGARTATVVQLRRLSGEADMLPR